MTTTKRAEQTPRHREVKRAAATLLLSAMALGCAPPTTSTKVLYADGYNDAQSATAVLGVVRSGSFDMQTWRSLTSRGVGLLHSCPAAYGEALKAHRPDVFEALEEATGSSLADEILPALAPAMRASLVLVIEVYGDIKEVRHGDGRGEVLLAHGGASSPVMSDTPPRFSETGHPDFEMTGVLYSGNPLREVARLEVEYSGSSEDEALAEFATQFHGTFGELTCGGWNWAAVQGVRETDAAGLPLPGLRLVPTVRTDHE